METLWKQTSQFKHWTLSNASLTEIRLHNTQKAIDSHSTPITVSAEDIISDSSDIILYYTQKIRDYATFFGLPYNVMATAICIFKRFYLHYTLLEYNPRIIVPTVILLSCKVENRHLSLRRIVEATKMPEEEIRDCEYVISQGIMFDFAIYHPFICLHALYLELQRTLTIDNSDNLNLATLYEKAIQIAADSYFGDCLFFYTPAQIALAAFRLAIIESSGAAVEEKFSFLFGFDDKVPVAEIMDELRRWSGFKVDTKKVKSVNKKYAKIFKQ